jgi:GDPmannose 4,6-dehydratase
MKAFITGINGQDGSYLAELLLSKGYEVHGIIRRSSVFNTQRIDHLMSDPKIYNKKLFVHHGDVTDSANINQLVSQIKPMEIYNLAAMSHVKVSFEIPSYTATVDALGTLNVLEAARNHCPEVRVYQASTSEMFGGMGYNMPEEGYNEQSPFHPRSPYGVAKIYGYWITRNYKEAYNLFCCNGLLFNHESPRRGDTFVTKKITNWFRANVEALNFNKHNVLQLGNLNSFRDWGHAKDYVEAMWLMLQRETPEDYVIATGEAYSIKQFIEYCCKFYGFSIVWKGEGLQEQGFIDRKLAITVDEKYFRPSEVQYLLGNPFKAKNELGWRPKYTFNSLIEEMLLNKEKT